MDKELFVLIGLLLFSFTYIVLKLKNSKQGKIIEPIGDYIESWEEWFIEIAKVVARKSKDPSSKVGALIVDKRNRIVSLGFNGFVAGCDESHMTQERPIKYELVIHAEQNALLHSEKNLSGCRAFITHSPCAQCLKQMLQVGIREVYYNDPSIVQKRGTPETKEGIKRLILSTKAKVQNINGTSYMDEIHLNNETESK